MDKEFDSATAVVFDMGQNKLVGESKDIALLQIKALQDFDVRGAKSEKVKASTTIEHLAEVAKHQSVKGLLGNLSSRRFELDDDVCESLKHVFMGSRHHYDGHWGDGEPR